MCTGPALADIAGCPKADIPVAAQKALLKTAKREFGDPLNLATLYYCTSDELARATVETIPVPQDDGSESGGTLACSSPLDRPKDWYCEVNRYRAIRVAAGPGQPEVRVAVGDRASIAQTRERASQAFALLSQPGRVEACRGATELGQSTESLRAILARRDGPYRLVISREGFALMRGSTHVRFKSGGIECWEGNASEE
jgi:hypothetical protein